MKEIEKRRILRGRHTERVKIVLKSYLKKNVKSTERTQGVLKVY